MQEQNTTSNNSQGAIEQALSSKMIAIVGLSSKPESPSYGVGKYLQSEGYSIIPVNPNEESVLGETAYPSLREVPHKVDVVDIFRRADAVPQIVSEAIEIGAPVVWMQLGIVHEEAAQQAQEAGLAVVMDRCMKIEHGLRHR